jgi:hypothetical protein
MSAITPPLLAMITAVRNRMLFWAVGMIAGSCLQSKRNCSNPSRSLDRIMLRASLRFFPPVSSQPSEGRTRSAPTATSSELVIISNRHGE